MVPGVTLRVNRDDGDDFQYFGDPSKYEDPHFKVYYTDQYGNDKDGWVVPVQLAVATKVPAAQAAVGTGAQAPIDHRLAPAPAAAQSSNYSEHF